MSKQIEDLTKSYGWSAGAEYAWPNAAGQKPAKCLGLAVEHDWAGLNQHARVGTKTYALSVYPDGTSTYYEERTSGYAKVPRERVPQEVAEGLEAAL